MVTGAEDGDERPGDTASPGKPVREAGSAEDALSLWQELRGLTHDRFRLAALETQRAGKSLVSMIVAGVLLALLLNAAWLGLVAAAVLLLVEYGVPASQAILLAVAVNVLFALMIFAEIRRKSRYLRFPSTLRSLRPMATDYRDGETS